MRLFGAWALLLLAGILAAVAMYAALMIELEVPPYEPIAWKMTTISVLNLISASGACIGLLAGAAALFLRRVVLKKSGLLLIGVTLILAPITDLYANWDPDGGAGRWIMAGVLVTGFWAAIILIAIWVAQRHAVTSESQDAERPSF